MSTPMRTAMLVALSLTSYGMLGCDGSESLDVARGAVTGGGQVLGIHGGSNGPNAFNLRPIAPERLQDIKLWTGALVDAFQFTYQNGGSFRVSAKAGGNGGTLRELVLNSGEYIGVVYGRSGALLDQLCFVRYGAAVSASLCGGGSGGAIWGNDYAGFDSNGNYRQIAGAQGTSGADINNVSFIAYSP